MIGPSPAGVARCASHPDRPVAFTCDRCGAFGCDECRSAAGQAVCRACEARIGPRLPGRITAWDTVGGAVAMTVRGVRFVAVGSLAGAFLSPLGILLFDSINRRIGAPRSPVTHDPRFSVWLAAELGGLAVYWVVYMFVFVLLIAAWTIFFVDGLLGQARPVSEVLKATVGRFAASMAAMVVAGTLVTFAFACLVLPGIYLSALWFVVIPAVVIDGVDPVAALGRSAAMIRGHRGVALIAVVAFLAIIAAPLIAISSAGASAWIPGAANQYVVAAVTGYLTTLCYAPWVAAEARLYLRLKAEPDARPR